VPAPSRVPAVPRPLPAAPPHRLQATAAAVGRHAAAAAQDGGGGVEGVGGEVPAAGQRGGGHGDGAQQDVGVPALQGPAGSGSGQVLLAAREAQQEAGGALLHAAAPLQRVPAVVSSGWRLDEAGGGGRSDLLLVGALLRSGLLRHLLHRRELARFTCFFEDGRFEKLGVSRCSVRADPPVGGAPPRLAVRLDVQREGALQPGGVLGPVGELQANQSLGQPAVLEGVGQNARQGEGLREGREGVHMDLRTGRRILILRLRGDLTAGLRMSLRSGLETRRTLNPLLKVQQLAQEVKVGRDGWSLLLHEPGHKEEETRDALWEM